MYRVILGMAKDQKSVVEKAKSFAGELKEHVMKCIIYGDTLGQFDHWTDEIANWIYIINRYEIKSKSRRMSKNNYAALFYNGIEDAADADAELYEFLHITVQRKKQYPEFELTQDLIERLTKAYLDLKETMSQKLSEYKFDSHEEVHTAVKDILSHYI